MAEAVTQLSRKPFRHSAQKLRSTVNVTLRSRATFGLVAHECIGFVIWDLFDPAGHGARGLKAAGSEPVPEKIPTTSYSDKCGYCKDSFTGSQVSLGVN